MTDPLRDQARRYLNAVFPNFVPTEQNIDQLVAEFELAASTMAKRWQHRHEHHRCPTCGCKFSDERKDAAMTDYLREARNWLIDNGIDPDGQPMESPKTWLELLAPLLEQTAMNARAVNCVDVVRPTRFQPGMKIGAGYGREVELVLVKLYSKGPFGMEVWTCTDGKNWRFYPDDLVRVIVECQHTFVGTPRQCCKCGELPPAIAVENLEPAPPEKPTWKPGQTWVRGKNCISRLVSHDTTNEHFDVWHAKHWDVDKWTEPLRTSFPLIEIRRGTYEPWPRVGDWVRDAVFNRIFQVADGVTTSGTVYVHEDNGRQHLIADLEPASPHVEQSERDGIEAGLRDVAAGRVRPLKDIERELEPPQSFTGAHWYMLDRKIERWYYDDHRCILDLRDELLRMRARLEGTHGSVNTTTPDSLSE